MIIIGKAHKKISLIKIRYDDGRMLYCLLGKETEFCLKIYFEPEPEEGNQDFVGIEVGKIQDIVL